MQIVRPIAWRRGGPGAALALLLFAATNPGCSCDDGNADDGPPTSSSGAGGDGGGGTADIGKATAVASDKTPFDATPDPDGNRIYFTAYDPAAGESGAAGVYTVAADGGDIDEVFVGAPLVSPFGIAISNDGKQLYIADAAAESETTTDEDDRGQIFALSPEGGTPTPLSGTTGYAPRGLEVTGEGGGDIVFSGHDPQSGEGGVFKVASGGGGVSALFVGEPLSDPSGVAITADGAKVFVADTRGSGSGKAAIFLIAGDDAEEFLGEIDVGFPAGIALSKDDSTLFVSGLDPNTLTDVVLVVDVASKEVSTYTGDDDTDFSQFEEPAGLHRAKNADVFAWADSKANENGTVYVIGK
jgi:sugar lactone lactonase YvrE